MNLIVTKRTKVLDCTSFDQETRVSHNVFQHSDVNTMPEYLDESDYDDEEIDDNERMTTWGCSSLEERLEEQRKEEVRMLALQALSRRT